MLGEVVLRIVDDSRIPYFSHGDPDMGRYCLTIYPGTPCTCGDWRLKWVIDMEHRNMAQPTHPEHPEHPEHPTAPGPGEPTHPIEEPDEGTPEHPIVPPVPGEPTHPTAPETPTPTPTPQSGR